MGTQGSRNPTPHTHSLHRNFLAPQVHKMLGKGSYGKVYKVERVSDGKCYALKETNLGNLSHLERMDAVNEVRLLVSISHPSVVRAARTSGDGNLRHGRTNCQSTSLSGAPAETWPCQEEHGHDSPTQL